jgi:RNA polymerase sigma factor (sigma-70 family)
MPEGSTNRLLSQLRQAALQTGGSGLTDGALLTRFVECRDEAAFAALVRRHGPMVLGVCRRVLGNVHDAEDAFQATFLVLARKAGSLRARELVGNWLYGTADRTALEQRSAIARRQARERQVADMPDPCAPEEVVWHELRTVLDRELSQLPDKYRVPVVLCDLEGKSRREVAGHLRIPEGTLSSRLATARRLLAGRLARYGLVLSGASLAVLLEQGAASASVPAALAAATTRAALLIVSGQTAAGAIPVTVAALAEGVLRTMFLAKIKTASLVVVGVAALSLGTAGVFYQARAGAADPQQSVSGQRATPAPTGEDTRRPLDRVMSVRELLNRLEKAQNELEHLRAELAKQRKEALDRQQVAEEALRQAREEKNRATEAERKARLEAERAFYAAAIQQAQNQFQSTKQPPGSGQSTVKPTAASQRGDEEAGLRREFADRRKALQDELRKLDAQENEALSKLQRQHAESRRQRGGPGAGSRVNKSATGGDKLDRILERLERIEQRLDQLERGRSRGGERP